MAVLQAEKPRDGKEEREIRMQRDRERVEEEHPGLDVKWGEGDRNDWPSPTISASVRRGRALTTGGC